MESDIIFGTRYSVFFMRDTALLTLPFQANRS